MKNYFLLAFSFLWCALGHASELHKTETLAAKVGLVNQKAYYVLSDNSCYKVVGFSKRWRSLREWWNRVELAPETYNCVPEDWDIGTPIEVYEKASFPMIPFENASNKDKIVLCSHVFVNTRSQQVLFAFALGTGECMVDLFKAALKEGYDQGYQKGYNQGEARCAHEYKRGYRQGSAEANEREYQKGYRQGLEDGSHKITRPRQGIVEDLHQVTGPQRSQDTRLSTGFGTTDNR